MSSVTTLSSQEPDFVLNLLNENHLTNAAVIDDAFDLINDNDEITLDKIQKFHQKMKASPLFEAVLKANDIHYPGDAEVEEEEEKLLRYLNQLWRVKDIDKDFHDLLREIFESKFQKLHDVEVLSENLKALNISVEPFGSDISDKEAVFKEKLFSFVFIDFYLGKENEHAIKHAISTIKTIYEWYPVEKKPVFVLMSSLPDISEQHKEDFRKEVIEGVFRFSSKTELIDKPIFILILGILSKDYKYRHELKSYRDTLFNAAAEALNDFKDNIKELKVEDYLFIQHLSLQNDKQPLGKYIGWLYGSYWGHLLQNNEALKKDEKRLNALSNIDMPIMHEPPSDILAKIYTTALFEEVEDIDVSTLLNDRGDRKEQGDESVETEESDTESRKSSPSLQLGDIFTNKANQRVWMIINAQCDLERNPPGDRSIFFLPGDLLPMNKTINEKEDKIRTEIFRHNGTNFRVSWKILEVITRRFDGIEQWKAESSYMRTFRLKPLFALEIQRSFASNLTRIGLPVPPPISEPINIEVYYSYNGSTEKLIEPDKGYAIEAMIRGSSNSVESRIKFTYKFAIEFKKALTQALKKLGIEDLAPEVKEKELLYILYKNFDKWFLNIHSNDYSLPSDDSPKDLKTKVCLMKDWSTGKPFDSKRFAALINIRYNLEEEMSTVNEQHATHS